MNEFGRLKRLAMRRPQEAMRNQAKVDAEWRDLNYHTRPDFDLAAREHDRFAEVIKSVGAEIVYLPEHDSLTMDSLYVRDAAAVCPKGVILCNMGKPARRGEPAIHGQAFEKAGIPVLGGITGEGSIEGGDLIWLDEKTVAIGRTYRTNDEGIRQFKNLVGADVHVEVSALPHYKGQSDVFHLMSIISPLDKDLQLVYSPLMPIPFREWLLAKGMNLVEVPDSEFASMGCNVLAIAPREVVMVKGNPETKKRMEAAGCKVHVIEADAISVPGEGGPTCLTRPLIRG
ncbi:dimethylarginine dimethylaminohydrolase family protein [Dongia soli]|uniref:arginine deiminase n=1 Tax=Dongia soli TaxID=600628 RepID=A0ABU5E9F2_9PROT|nr:arginine deiminase family protein [Dongia soli]MDY0882958.1 arginine deiminase family protein [Dongia soli]